MTVLPLAMLSAAEAQTFFQRMPAIERGIGLTVAGCERLARVYADLAASNPAWSGRASEAADRLGVARQAQANFMGAKRSIGNIVRTLTASGRLAPNDPSVRYLLDMPAESSVRTGGDLDPGFRGLGELLTVLSGTLFSVLAAIFGAVFIGYIVVIKDAEIRAKQVDAENVRLAQEHSTAMQAWEELAAAQVAAGAPALPPLPEMPGYGRQDTSGGSIVDAIKEGAGAGFGALLPLLAIGGLVWILVNRRPSKGRR